MKKILFFLEMISGVILLVLGFTYFDNENTKVISGLSLGIGIVLFIFGLSYFIINLKYSEKQINEINKQKNINVKDERNTLIKEKTSYSVSRIMNYVFIILLILSFIFKMNIMVSILILSVIIIKLILMIIYSDYYSKQL